MNSIFDLKLTEFNDNLASDSAVPGGGAVASICASFSSSLITMVTNLTIGKKFYLEYSDDIKQKFETIKETADSLRIEFLKLSDKDNASFEKVMTAFKLPKESDEDKTIRSKAIQSGYVEAMNVPLNVARKAIKLYEYIDFCIEYGNPNALSDIGVACLTLGAAIEGALFNVQINLMSIKDAELVATTTVEFETILNETKQKRENLITKIREKIQK